MRRIFRRGLVSGNKMRGEVGVLLEGFSSGIKEEMGLVLINTISSCWKGGAEVSASRCRGGEWAETGATEGQRLPTERCHNLCYITSNRNVNR